jgi:hypothetical protein
MVPTTRRQCGQRYSGVFQCLLDAEQPTAVATAVQLGVFGDFRALEARKFSTAPIANHPPVRRFEPLAMLGCVERIRPLVERSPVVRLSKLVVLPCVNQFLTHGRTELLPAVLLEGVQRERDRYLTGYRVVFRRTGRPLSSVGHLPFNRFNRQVGEMLNRDVRRWCLRPIEQVALCRRCVCAFGRICALGQRSLGNINQVVWRDINEKSEMS